MAGEINWKMKYQELKAKYMESVDMAFRLGYEQGGQEATQAAAQQQQAQQQQQMQQMQGGMGGQEDPNAQPGQDGNGPTMPAGPGQGIQDPNAQPDSENPAGSELDQHIAKLESMVNKSEEVQATIAGLKAMKKSMEFKSEMKKSSMAIPAIAKALHKPAFKMSQQANHNLSTNAKQAVNMQQKIVTDIMAKWEQEESGAKKDILSQLGIEGLTKKEK